MWRFSNRHLLTSAFLKSSLPPLQEQDGVSAEARKSARYFLYRKYVYVSEGGAIGANNRIRIPKCVLERIRWGNTGELRVPGCSCTPGGSLSRCSKYVGHRDAAV